MAMMQMQMLMRSKKHRKPLMDQRRILRTDLGSSDVDGYECEDGNDPDADEEHEALPPDDGSTQNVED